MGSYHSTSTTLLWLPGIQQLESMSEDWLVTWISEPVSQYIPLHQGCLSHLGSIKDLCPITELLDLADVTTVTFYSYQSDF